MSQGFIRSEGGTMNRSYYVRDGASGTGAFSTAAAGAYVAVGLDGTRFPYWTWQKPDPLPLEEAQALMEAALRMGCSRLQLQPAED